MRKPFRNAGYPVLCAAGLSAGRSVRADACARCAHAYVANQNDGTVSVIDTQSDEVVRTLDLHAKTDGKLQAAIADRADKTLFVVDATGSKLIVVDLASGEIRTRVAAGQSPRRREAFRQTASRSRSAARTTTS
jgi:DNA-binding beta-propeller fold protein YncE